MFHLSYINLPISEILFLLQKFQFWCNKFKSYILIRFLLF